MAGSSTGSSQMDWTDIVIHKATNLDCALAIKLVSSVLKEFQLRFEPGSKDADF
jgi:hypothetical protein